MQNLQALLDAFERFSEAIERANRRAVEAMRHRAFAERATTGGTNVSCADQYQRLMEPARAVTNLVVARNRVVARW